MTSGPPPPYYSALNASETNRRSVIDLSPSPSLLKPIIFDNDRDYPVSSYTPVRECRVHRCTCTTETTPLRQPSRVIKYDNNRSDEGYCCRTLALTILALFLFVVPLLTFMCGLGLSGGGARRPEPHPYWETPTSEEHCHSYGTRQYTARLLNLSWHDNGIEWCERTPVIIHEVRLDRPDFCENRFSGVYGHWFVKHQEYRCLPYWSRFKDEGCTVRGSGFRRFSSHLMNIYPGEDWMTMCSTAPAEINHVFFPAPTYCVSKGIFGMYGIWEVDDANC